MNFWDFQRSSEFQSCIICFLVGFKQNKEDQQRMRKTFQMIDKNRDGFITLDEINSFQDGVLGDKFGSIMGRAVKPRELFSILD